MTCEFQFIDLFKFSPSQPTVIDPTWTSWCLQCILPYTRARVVRKVRLDLGLLVLLEPRFDLALDPSYPCPEVFMLKWHISLWMIRRLPPPICPILSQRQCVLHRRMLGMCFHGLSISKIPDHTLLSTRETDNETDNSMIQRMQFRC